MSEKNTDWTSFQQRIFINKPVQELYEAWAIPGQITEWFLERVTYTSEDQQQRGADELIGKGDRYSWKWHNWDFEGTGTVTEANGEDLISFTFGSAGNVDVYFKPMKGGTEVTLIQRDIPTDDEEKMRSYVGCSTGWTFWLTNLKAWKEHGIKLNATGLTQEETRHLVNS